MSEHNDNNSPAQRLATVQADIAAACKRANRVETPPTLIAVSKTHAAEAIAPVIALGHRDFGENRVQEAQGKWPTLREQYHDVRLHMIGQLQSNKAADAVALFDMIHSLDRPSLAKALAKAMADQGKQVPCLIQVNIGDEEQKGGCAVSDIGALLETAKGHKIPAIGLMCIPPADLEPAPYFALLDKLANDHGLTERSMGMSGDYVTATEIGSTMLRVGSALFGPRGG
ncbi:YggS family pyridoxal phosphate-dependent enzyme [Alterisphingorhabdus coralli]|uniref:Pyridoxal phosphate homeostasis protein n=1 Tax=Alterisphingorhabdus coralli TaxID=3071408 RepID=A0AA97I0K6_9SPHN|nr:YggS family pyridoxal phosphate-dependent enzyme [Parasphingorhabdus sp. SCSIO 66989]WOE75062.1 YggS family pyridoxal phosphate-dependent enzyme [Parasphingorhabdus sp. SCSIO 66989]